MTTDPLTKTRKALLASLKDPQAPEELLMDLLSKAEKQFPELMHRFEPGVGRNALDPDKISWNAEYFSRHLLLTEQNFARERIEHLLAVREHLRKLGVKGFVPKDRPSNPSSQGEHHVTSNYTPSLNLQKFVAEGDLLTIRTALRMELNDNSLSAQQVRAALVWARGHVAGLLEAYSEKSFAREIEADRNLWTSQYYAHQVVYLKANFAEERFLHLVEVRNHLRQQGVEGFTAVPPRSRAGTHASSVAPAQARSQSKQSESSSPYTSPPERNPVFKAALLIGGALAALVVLLIAIGK
ncbi:hypothetical protein IQ22_03940 [Pseudomonas duriflava]|uniref:Uncharacterized protein n=1 Tax=Pseudomonas duriflava TaxID=459528 RepID=A0A562PYX5_9PSED|nr:hypothetical protein [Pseudomonas duriflava]TWI49617.1 hypothetical protein IQ22_03940 [Pseudomonas duriflava]